jgi:ABC-type thiamine transport system ATPase subunit
MAALEVVLAQERVQTALDLGRSQIPGLATSNPEALVQQRPVHALDEAVCAWRGDLGCAMLDVLHSQHQLVEILLGLAAELAAVAGQDGSDIDTQGLV